MEAINNQNTSRRWWIGFAIFLVILTTLPYLLAEIRAGDNWVFSGFLFGVQDGNSYIAKMLRGSAGEWLFATPYTAYPQTGVIAFLPYTLLGKLAAEPGLHGQLVAIFHFFRIAGIFFLVWALDQFMLRFIADMRLRRWGIALATCGGGLGLLFFMGLLQLWGESLPLEMYSPESFGFLMLMGLPHLLFARGLLLLSFGKLLDEDISWIKSGILAGSGLLLVGVFQPLTVAVAWAVMAAGLVGAIVVKILKIPNEINIQRFGVRIGIAGLVSSPVVLYTMIKFANDPVLSTWERQNILKSPPVGDYVWAFSLVLPFAILAILDILRKKVVLNQALLFLIIWLTCFPVLAYAPYPMQRRLPEGIWVVMVTLAMVFLAGKTLKTQKMLLVIMSIGFISTSTFWLGAVLSAWQVKSPIFEPISKIQFFREMNALPIPKDSVVLADEEISTSLPAWIPVRVLVGHGPESANLAEVGPRVEHFFRGTADIENDRKLIGEFNINFVVWDQDKYGAIDRVEQSFAELQTEFCDQNLCLLRVDK